MINQFKATVMYSSHCNHGHVCTVQSEHCPCGETGLPLSVFQAVYEMSQVGPITFQSPELISSVGLSGRKQCS